MARPELNVNDPVTEPRRIETLKYVGPAFRLEDGQRWEIYSIVDTHDAPVVKKNGIKIKDTHGKVRSLPWGTLVYPIAHPGY